MRLPPIVEYRAVAKLCQADKTEKQIHISLTKISSYRSNLYNFDNIVGQDTMCVFDSLKLPDYEKKVPALNTLIVIQIVIQSPEES